VLLEDRIGQFHRGALHNLVFKGGDREALCFPDLLQPLPCARRNRRYSTGA
jgi:hypothetical protein